MPYEIPPDLAGLGLAEIAEAVAARRLPPVDEWQPDAAADSGMEIRADGRWFHEGSEIRRPGMVRAFSSLLRRDEDGFWLVLPYQKQSIAVADAPFVAVDVKQDWEGGTPVLIFRLNTDEFVTADAEHPITARGDPDTPALYVRVRGGLDARLDRSTYAQLAEIAIVRDADTLAVESKGATFPLVPR
ncbi:DUF1285 domain-containing protein [Croceicoccus marinus]|jgi:hypothetical protein|uniref:DUF1285 domain-containing protein n=1 Tax=Croceicoccus marinus TaxID=450378 RepID=A0A7G6VWQ6_9SPHN|nr:DUF1285 domain-containing protein [Croceicoccus marinus]QNE06171.1 DUF1285 domain-containing protein [Croceicoccus marinus]